MTVDPLRPEFVYCGTFGSGLWRSDNAGESWRPAREGIRHSRVQSVTVSRSERMKGRGIVYVGTEPSAIFRSEDAGEIWRECGGLTALPSASEWSFPPRPETHHVRWIEADPHVQGRLFVAIEAGALIRSADSGTTWQDRAACGPRHTHQLSIHLSASERLYSAAGDGYFESRDGGDTWQQFEEGLRHRYLWSIAIDLANADIIVVSAAASARHSHSEPAESYLYRRMAGSPWQELRDGLPKPAAAPLFWPPIRPSRERSFRLGSTTSFVQSTAARAGAVWMCLGRRIVALTSYGHSRSPRFHEKGLVQTGTETGIVVTGECLTME